MSLKPWKNTPISLSTSVDADLIGDVANGDHKAFAELMLRYKAPLYRFILRYVGVAQDAEDLLQDVFVSLYSKASSYDPAWKPSTWIYRIALNKCRDHGRKQRLRRFVSLDRNADPDEKFHFPEAIDASPNVESVIIHRQELQRFALALEELPHAMRSAVVLHLVEERPQTECAELLGVTRKSVEMLIYRARKALREKMGAEFEPRGLRRTADCTPLAEEPMDPRPVAGWRPAIGAI